MGDSAMRAAVGEAYRAGRSSAKYDRYGKTPATQKRGRSRSRSRSKSNRRSRSITTGRVVKRLRFSSRTASRPRTAVPVGTAVRGTAELSRSKSGSRRPRRVTFKQLSKVSLQRRILRWQWARPMNRPIVSGAAGFALPGAQPLVNLVTKTAGATDTYRVPAVMYCLNSTINDNNAVGPQVAGEIQFDDTGGFSFLNTMQTQDPGANNSFTPGKWEIEWQNHGTGAVTPYTRYINTSWYDIRLLLYGAKKQPTQYEVHIFKFKDSWLDPLVTPTDAKQIADRNAFYQTMVYDYIKNPILTSGATKMFWAKTKTLYRKRIDIPPSHSDEDDPTANRHALKIFLNDGRTYDYMTYGEQLPTNDGLGGYLNNNAALAGDVLITNDPRWSWYKPQGGDLVDYNDMPKPRARIWLMVRAMNTSMQTSGFTTVNGVAPGADFTVSQDNTPSFDIMIRKKESYSLA